MSIDSMTHRKLRRLLRIRDSMTQNVGGSAEATEWSNIVFQRLLFVRLLSELEETSRNPGIQLSTVSEEILYLVLNMDPTQYSVPESHYGVQKLGLFTSQLPNIETTDTLGIVSEVLSTLIELDFNRAPVGTILDQRILLLGSVFEGLRSQKGRRKRGVFYTPFNLAKRICDISLDAIEFQDDHSSAKDAASSLLSLRILDNACGGGVFLMAMFESVLERILSLARNIGQPVLKTERGAVDLSDPLNIGAHLIKHVLFGHDLDSGAIDIAEAHFWLAMHCIIGQDRQLNMRQNLDVRDSLIAGPSVHPYDIVVGNPPYLRLTAIAPEYRQTIKQNYATKREYNIHALFVEESLKHLRTGGVLSYLLHKNLLTLDTYADLRGSILESHNLVHLSDCGPGLFKNVTAETAILVVRKGIERSPMPVTLSRYNQSSADCESTMVLTCKDYWDLVTPWNNRFLIGITDSAIPLLQELQKLPSLDSQVKISRGIETGNNAEFVTDSPVHPGDWKPVLRGRDISMYHAKQRVYIDYDRSKLTKPGRPDLQELPKIVVQQNSRSPIAYFDTGEYLVLNSTTYLADAEESMLKAICVILNSSLASWFFRTIMTNNAGLTVNLLPNNLGMIPIPQSLEVGTMSVLYDILAHLRFEGRQSREMLERYNVWHQIIAESVVLEAYFPSRLGECKITRRLEKQNASSPGVSDFLSTYKNEELAHSARLQIEKMQLPRLMSHG